MNLKKIKCIIVDFDETLYSDGDWSGGFEFFGKYLTQQNLLPEIPDVMNKFRYLINLHPEYNNHIIKAIFAYLNDNNIETESFRKFFKDNIWYVIGEKTRFIDPKIILEVSKFYKLYIISDSSLPYLNFYLEHAEIDKNSFDGILSNNYDDEGYTKIPMMKRVLEETRLKSDEIIMIGDSEDSDIKPAKLIGFQSCLVESVDDTLKILQDLINLKSSRIN